MKRELINLVAGVGITLLGGAVILIILTGMLFMFPNLSFFGIKSVNERDTQIVYRDSVLDEAFANGHLIIESTDSQIEVKMSNDNYEGEGTIVVNESATGIAFNDLNRTLIQWTQTLYHGELYYRLKVLEPSGIVFDDEPTTIYINLPHRAVSDSFQHHFVLQSGYSNVNFSFVDNTVNQNDDSLKIGDLVVESASSVNIPSSPNISLNNIKLNGRSTKFTCQSAVLGNVEVLGANGQQTFNSSIAGDVTIKGENNAFSGDTAANVVFDSENGSLDMNSVQTMKVATIKADIDVGKVAAGMIMSTKSGNLNVDAIEGNGLQFIAGVAEAPYATANLTVGSVIGNVDVKNYGTGKIELNNVNGNVDIDSSQIDGGTIDVGFSDDAENCKVKIFGYDGDINVAGINGVTEIELRNWVNGAGAANVYAHFNQVVGDANVIRTSGYVSGHHDWGNVEIELSNSCNSFDLYVYGASSANSSAKYGFEDKNMHIIGENDEDLGNEIMVGGIVKSGAVRVHTKQSLYLS